MVCESCRFGYIEPNDDGYYCEAKDDVFKAKTQCACWACKLGKIGTPEEYEHNIHTCEYCISYGDAGGENSYCWNPLAHEEPDNDAEVRKPTDSCEYWRERPRDGE